MRLQLPILLILSASRTVESSAVQVNASSLPNKLTTYFPKEFQPPFLVNDIQRCPMALIETLFSDPSADKQHVGSTHRLHRSDNGAQDRRCDVARDR
ncbi:hypothetical protein Q1695_013774 [Nippostrongylus brasiliensis]|nr:hypothetical protein Q1695_013774 [Nippostrongylus brasiliensis]